MTSEEPPPPTGSSAPVRRPPIAPPVGRFPPSVPPGTLDDEVDYANQVIDPAGDLADDPEFVAALGGVCPDCGSPLYVVVPTTVDVVTGADGDVSGDAAVDVAVGGYRCDVCGYGRSWAQHHALRAAGLLDEVGHVTGPPTDPSDRRSRPVRPDRPDRPRPAR